MSTETSAPLRPHESSSVAAASRFASASPVVKAFTSDRRDALRFIFGAVAAASASLAAGSAAIAWRRRAAIDTQDGSVAVQSQSATASNAGSNQPNPVAAAVPGKPPRPGLNAGGFNYWSGNRPFINVAHCAGSTWSGVTATAANRGGTELLQLAPGAKSSQFIIMHNKVGEGYVRPGRYVMTWDGPLQLRFTQTTSANASRRLPGNNQVEVLVPALTDKTNGAIFIAIEAHNPTSSAQDLRNLAIVHEDDLAAHAAGEWLAPSWVEQARTASVVRFMDWSGTNDSPVVRAEDFARPNHTDWARVPPQVIGAAGTKVGCDIWVCLPHQADAAAASYFFREIALAYPEGRIYVEYSNETWNFQFRQAHWLSAGASFAKDGRGKVSNLARGAAVGSMRAWAAAEAVFGRKRVVRVFSGQAAWFDALAGAFEVSHPDYYSGQPLRSLVDAYAIAPYFDLRDGGKDLPANQGNRARSERKDHLQPDSYFISLAQVGIAKAAANVAAAASRLQALAPQARLISYEGGTHELISLDDYDGARNDGPRARVDTTRNTLVFEEDILALFEDGEQAYVYWCGDQALYVHGQEWNAANKGWTPFWVRRIDTRNLRCYASEALYRSDQPVTLLPSGSIPEDKTRHYVGNFTRLSKLSERIQNFMDAPAGADIYDHYLNALEAAGMGLFMHFTDAGTYGKLGQGSRRSFQFGLKRSHFETDEGYARAAWFRRIALSRQG